MRNIWCNSTTKKIFHALTILTQKTSNMEIALFLQCILNQGPYFLERYFYRSIVKFTFLQVTSFIYRCLLVGFFCFTRSNVHDWLLCVTLSVITINKVYLNTSLSFFEQFWNTHVLSLYTLPFAISGSYFTLTELLDKGCEVNLTQNSMSNVKVITELLDKGCEVILTQISRSNVKVTSDLFNIQF